MRTLPLLLLLFLLTACDGDSGERTGDTPPEAVTLEVTVQDWTGWSEEQPEPSSFTVTVAEGGGFEARMLGETVTVEVVGVDDDRIVLEASEELAPDGDYNDLTDTFALERDGEVTFGTPSVDGGTNVTVAER